MTEEQLRKLLKPEDLEELAKDFNEHQKNYRKSHSYKHPDEYRSQIVLDMYKGITSRKVLMQIVLILMKDYGCLVDGETEEDITDFEIEIAETPDDETYLRCE